MIRRPPRSTQSRSSAASDVYKRQVQDVGVNDLLGNLRTTSKRGCFRIALVIQIILDSLMGHNEPFGIGQVRILRRKALREVFESSVSAFSLLLQQAQPFYLNVKFVGFG